MPPGCTCVQPMLLFSLLFDLTNTIIQRLALFQSWSGSVFRQSHTWARCCSPSTPSIPWGWGWPTTDGESSVEDSNTASRPPLSSGIPDESVPAKTVSSTPVSQPNPATRPTTKLRRKEGCNVENQQMFLQFRLYKFAMCASARRGVWLNLTLTPSPWMFHFPVPRPTDVFLDVPCSMTQGRTQRWVPRNKPRRELRWLE